MVNITDRSAGAGVPAQWSEDITAVDIPLWTGDYPAPLTQDLIVAASQTIPAYTPVGFDGSGRIVPAVSGTTQAIGFTVAAIASPSGSSYIGAPIYRSGVVNPDKLNWPASYDTEAEKFAAFNGAPSPTQIVVRRPKTLSV